MVIPAQVSTFSQTVTIENDHHHRHDHHRELADVMVVMVVTVLLYCFTQQKEGCAPPLFPLGVGLARPTCSLTSMPVMVTPAQISTFSQTVTIENDRHHHHNHHNHHREQFGAAVAVVVTVLRLRRVFMTQASSSA
ncbi:hypothetical protein V4C85_20805 [Ralstonia solanacearum]|uniref:hypothetical protein n=1 Tax=Ralstonia solanacearum TaxID=305 RepID=UPI0007C8A85C|nr:hypothetical protein [Ralstonia solanacearum]OAI79037.1 hypothetical protein RSP597_00930 [Ralstonia solanacearum]